MVFKDFEIRQCMSLNDEIISDKYELIKWTTKGFDKRYCFVVAYIEFDRRELGWEFRSVGTRYLEHYVNGLNEWILKYLDCLKLIIKDEDEDYE